MIDKNNEFLFELAALLEKHRIAICSRNTGEYSEVFFQKMVKTTITNIETNRLHVTAYDLRGFIGMSGDEANNLYRIYRKYIA